MIEWQYPSVVKMGIGELLAIYTSQTMGNMLLPRFASYSSNKLQIASYFGGETHKDMMILFLNDNEDPKDFKDSLITFYHNVVTGAPDFTRLEAKFQESFSKIEAHQQQNESILKSIETKFEAVLELFKDMVELLDGRMTRLENNILNLTSSRGSGE